MSITVSIIVKDGESYEWVSMFPGSGHLNMNQITSLFRLLDKICIQPLGKDVLNLKCVNAFQFLNNAKDSHKYWLLKYFSRAQYLN